MDCGLHEMCNGAVKQDNVFLEISTCTNITLECEFKFEL
jgi:hypothetical protein